MSVIEFFKEATEAAEELKEEQKQLDNINKIRNRGLKRGKYKRR